MPPAQVAASDHHHLCKYLRWLIGASLSEPHIYIKYSERVYINYCIVGVDHFDLIDNFKVSTMSECIEEMQYSGDITMTILCFSGRCL